MPTRTTPAGAAAVVLLDVAAYAAGLSSEQVDAVVRRFPGMSRAAALAVAMARPSATEVASRKGWAQRGRQVLPGQAPILVPVVDHAGRATSARYVYDLAQTQPRRRAGR